jgi:dTDP-3-amino-3,4,6-trideoxy-alpha-D-glucose transaminase
MIRFHDLRLQYEPLQAEIQESVHRVLQSGRFILGDEVASFETEFAEYMGAPHAIGVASGTEAITLALRACGVQPGDEVITAANTAVATVAAIELAHAQPVLADIDPQRFTLDPRRLAEVVSSKTRAIVPVHLYGCPAEVRPVMAFAKEHGLKVIEDCAQACGSLCHGQKAGTFGDAAAFSFYPTKNLGALGDGGAVITSDPGIADRVRLLRQYGWNDQRLSVMKGFNSRLDEMQAAILRIGLRSLDAWNAERIRLAARYCSLLEGSPVLLPAVPHGCLHTFHRFVIRTSWRDPLRKYLADQGMETQIHYPIPIHRQPAYLELAARRSKLHETENAAREILSLPLYPGLKEDMTAAIAEKIKVFFAAHAA